MGRYDRSIGLLKRAESSEAWATYRFKNFSQYEGEYPYYASRAKGAYIWDVDGNKYIDYLLGYGTIILGHADERVTRAVIKELRTGNNVSPLWKPIQIELTNLLTTVIPGSEMGYLMKSGSDATSAAVRLARIFTKRDKVVRWGYHGWHDWAVKIPNGIPSCIKKNVLEFEYNNVDSLQRVFRKHPKEIACIIMMPFELEKPKLGFLEEVKSIAHENGAIFILDEMRSGFRISLGGAQEFYNIKADLATFSKAMSNGHSISAVVGRRDILAGLKDTILGATFFGNTSEIAAAITTINILKKTKALKRIWKLGDLLRSQTEKLIQEYGVQAQFMGYAPFPYLHFNDPDLKIREKNKRIFYIEAARRGVFIHPNHHWYISASHSFEDIKKTIKVFRLIFESVYKCNRA